MALTQRSIHAIMNNNKRYNGGVVEFTLYFIFAIFASFSTLAYNPIEGSIVRPSSGVAVSQSTQEVPDTKKAPKHQRGAFLSPAAKKSLQYILAASVLLTTIGVYRSLRGQERELSSRACPRPMPPPPTPITNQSVQPVRPTRTLPWQAEELVHAVREALQANGITNPEVATHLCNNYFTETFFEGLLAALNPPNVAELNLQQITHIAVTLTLTTFRQLVHQQDLAHLAN